MESGWRMHREQQREALDTGLHGSPLPRTLPTPGQGQLAHLTGESGNLGDSHLPTGGWPGGVDFQLGQGAHSLGQVVAQPPFHSLDPVPMPPGPVPSRTMHTPFFSVQISSVVGWVPPPGRT